MNRRAFIGALIYVIALSLEMATLQRSALAVSQPRTLTFSDLLRRLVDLRRLPLLEDGIYCRQFSSYDRASKAPDQPGWGANKDWGNYIRIEPDGEAVMAEIDGPGCIVRIWSANPQGKIRFYLDGSKQPLEFNFRELFTNKIYPFVPPLCGFHGAGANSYLPIPFGKSCKVTADKAHGQYYHITYVTFPKSWRVQTFKLPLTADEKRVLNEVLDILNRVGEDPKPRPPDIFVRTMGQEMFIPAGQTVTLALLRGPVIVRAFRAKLRSKERWALRKILLRVYWDDEPEPSIWCPIGDFFGTGFYENKYKSLPLGVTEDGGYCYWAMPFRKSARFEVVNDGERHAWLRFSIEFEYVYELPPNTAYFHAKWRREAPNRTFDYPFLICKGHGKYVGAMLNVHNPAPRWWGEGDEKVWVDDEPFPSTFGTGSEDYFGDAWGFRPFINPYHGCTLREKANHSGRTSVYRWHVLDAIPFYKSFKITIENYGTDKDYSSVAYWYQIEPGEDFFKPVGVSARIPWSARISGAIEIEDIAPRDDPRLKIIDDSDLPKELSNGRGVLFIAQKPTDEFSISVKAPRDDVYELVLHSMAGIPHPDIEISVGGKRIGAFKQPFEDNSQLTLGRMRLPAGDVVVRIRVHAVRGEQRKLILDALELRASPKYRRALEAEALKFSASSGVEVIRDDARLNWSGWSQLLMKATQVGQYLELQLPPKLKGKFALIVRCTRGPNYGDVQVSIAGKTIGRTINGYAEKEHLEREAQLGIIELPGGNGNWLRFTVVGKDKRSHGYQLGIDYVRLGRIIVENAIEAEQLRIVRYERCRPNVQHMGAWGAERWSAENQLFCPGEKGGYVILEFDVKRAGEYHLDIYLTKAPDYGIVEVFLDGKRIGERFDGYHPRVVPSGRVSFGTVHLSAGKHQIQFQVVDKNPNSTNYFMGIDCIALTPRAR